jgi:hypothetical protein
MKVVSCATLRRRIMFTSSLNEISTDQLGNREAEFANIFRSPEIDSQILRLQRLVGGIDSWDP